MGSRWVKVHVLQGCHAIKRSVKLNTAIAEELLQFKNLLILHVRDAN
jgi:hypothetical protein